MDSVKHVTDAEFETEAIRAQMRSVIRVGVKTINNSPYPPSFKGTVRVVEPDQDVTIDGYRHHVAGRKYTKTLSVERPSAGDALDDAKEHREWCVSIQQMP